MTLAIDSDIFAPLFQDEEVARIFDDRDFLRAMLDIEAALARVEATLDIIPDSAGEKIAAIAAALSPDPKQIGRGTQRDGVPVIGLVKELRNAVGTEAAPYVHWGATTQDIFDTASVIQLRTAIAIMNKRLAGSIENLADLADQHRTTVMAGRTHGQQALPVSFGLKAAGWLAPLVRHKLRFDNIRSNVLQIQFGGAAGTQAALGKKGLSVMQGLARELDLNVPAMPWHTQRDGFAEFAGWLSMLTGSLAKMAQDVILLAQNEVAEVFESGDPNRGGSSSMPQKRNPVVSECIIAAARTNASLLSSMHHAMIQEHERATHGWQVEWLTLTQMVLLTAGTLKNAQFLTGNLKVDAQRMRENIERTNYLLLAEAAVQALAAEIPRTAAHDLVKQACAEAASEKRSLVEIVKLRFCRIRPDNNIDWKTLARPESYLGQTNQFIDRVLEEVRRLSID